MPSATATFHLKSRVFAGLFLVALLVSAAPAAARPLDLGIVDPLEASWKEQDPAGAFPAARAAGVSVVRVPVVWGKVAPRRIADPTNPDDPGYDWRVLDERVDQIVSAGMEPLVSVYSAPDWARTRGSDGKSRPSPYPTDFAAFMNAAARRYAGPPSGRTRVRLWQLWNEPNLPWYLTQPRSPAHYRAMVNAATPAIHRVHSDNVVVAGGLAPGSNPRTVNAIRFIREFFSEPVALDVWSQHPYTFGGPTHQAAHPEQVQIGDLSEVRRMLDSAERRGDAVAPRGLRLWVTEFSWDSKPPDPWGVPLKVHARWVSEALYRMWSDGVELVVWFQLRDNPLNGTGSKGFQSGLYFRTTPRYADERAKPALRAVRFPFVALPARRGTAVWGRTRGARAGRVIVERRRGRRWRRLVVLRADRHGVFRKKLRIRRPGTLRARARGAASLPFAARKTPDRTVYPFGGSPF